MSDICIYDGVTRDLGLAYHGVYIGISMHTISSLDVGLRGRVYLHHSLSLSLSMRSGCERMA